MDLCKCFAEIFGVSQPVFPVNGMRFEQLPYMMFEDGSFMIYE